MTNLKWIRTLSAKELSDLLYDYWLPRGQYVWTDSRKGLVKMLGETYLERDCDKCKHQGNCYCVKGFGCPFEPKTENSSEIPNNCEHITEDGVTCAKYPACDDCLDNPLNKLKGSERLVKGSEQTKPTISKMEQVDKPQKDCYMCKWLGEVDVCVRCRNRNLFCEAEPQPRCPKCGKRGYIRSLESMGVKLKVFDEYKWKCTNCNKYFKEEPKTEPQTDCSWK